MVGLLVTAPVLSQTVAPPTLKAMLAIVLTVLILPVTGWTPGAAVPEYTTGYFFMALIGEFALGIFLGWLADLYFQAVRFGGDLIGRTAGYSAAEVFNPDAGVPRAQSPVYL